MTTVLVTGGGGFLGQELVRQLLRSGYRVRTFSRRSYPQLEALGVEQRLGDLADPAAVAAAVAGVEAVLHNAAKPGIAGPYAEYFKANVLGTQHIIQACRDHGVAKLVYTSSPSVTFGGHDQAGVDESTPYPKHFMSAYAETKALGEQAVLHANSPQLQTVALRPHLIWGPGDQHLLPRLVQRAAAGSLWLVGNGAKLVDAVYIDNAAEAHLLALAALGAGSKVAGKAYYISNDEPWPMRRLIDGLLKASGLPPVTKRIPAWFGYLLGVVCEGFYQALKLTAEPPITRFAARQMATAHWYNIAAAKQDFGYIPQVSMADGMARLAASIRRQPVA